MDTKNSWMSRYFKTKKEGYIVKFFKKMDHLDTVDTEQGRRIKYIDFEEFENLFNKKKI